MPNLLEINNLQVGFRSERGLTQAVNGQISDRLIHYAAVR